METSLAVPSGTFKTMQNASTKTIPVILQYPAAHDVAIDTGNSVP
jgi:hypothetical protein